MKITKMELLEKIQEVYPEFDDSDLFDNKEEIFVINLEDSIKEGNRGFISIDNEQGHEVYYCDIEL